jgi:Reverse transcriptase (RNA-dependent DNA polymerase)
MNTSHLSIKDTTLTPPVGFNRIRVHIVYDDKHDGRHKDRLVADGHLADIPLDPIYSGVVSLHRFRLVLFLAELNKLQLWVTDKSNAYLEAYTSEKVYIFSGPEFGDREGHILVICKALYGLRSSGARWHDRFSDCIRELVFFPC